MRKHGGIESCQALPEARPQGACLRCPAQLRVPNPLVPHARRQCNTIMFMRTMPRPVTPAPALALRVWRPPDDPPVALGDQCDAAVSGESEARPVSSCKLSNAEVSPVERKSSVLLHLVSLA